MKFNHTAHKKMWTWLSENPEMDKFNWPGWEWNRGKYEEVENDCFACEACSGICASCPLVWPKNAEGENICDHEGGLWAEWELESFDRPETRSSLALQIANLPVKEGVETE